MRAAKYLVRRPRAGGDPVSFAQETLDSRIGGNDVAYGITGSHA
jgi:hypothetical protein